MKKILLVCSAGMSTSILVKKMHDAANAQDVKITIEAKPMAEAQMVINKWDIIMLAPAVKFIEKNIKKITDKPVVVIPASIYALGKGKEALDLALKTI